MIENWINKRYLNEVSELNQSFNRSKPYQHLIIKDLFNRNKLSLLRKEVLKEKFERQDTDLFSFSQTKELFASKNKFVKEFYVFLSSKEFIAFIKGLTGEKLGDKIDMHAHQYKQGDYLLFHDDKLENRKIAYVINLSTGFNPEDGGKLQLYNIKKPIKPAKEILPEFNSLVLFKVSNKSLHAVEEVITKKERLGLGGWFYGP